MTFDVQRHVYANVMVGQDQNVMVRVNVAEGDYKIHELNKIIDELNRVKGRAEAVRKTLRSPIQGRKNELTSK